MRRAEPAAGNKRAEVAQVGRVADQVGQTFWVGTRPVGFVAFRREGHQIVCAIIHGEQQLPRIQVAGVAHIGEPLEGHGVEQTGNKGPGLVRARWIVAIRHGRCSRAGGVKLRFSVRDI